jgi:hypothetical protein
MEGPLRLLSRIVCASPPRNRRPERPGAPAVFRRGVTSARRATCVGAIAFGALVAGGATAQDIYSGHPKLLFTASDLPALRAQLVDGGHDDDAYADIQAWSQTVLAAPPPALLGSWEGVHSIAQLGFTAQVETNGAAFAAKVREMVLWIVQNRGPTDDEHASALRLQSMALGYDLAFADATPAERATVRAEMRAYLDYMPPRFNYYCQAYNPYCGNHGMTVGASMGLGVIALWDDTSASGQDSLAAALAFAEPIVEKCLTDILPADGAYREGVLYAAWIMRVAVPYFEARRRFDGRDHADDPRFERMIEWLCYELSPDGTGRTHNLNDSSWSTRPLALHATFLEWAQARWASPLARYLHDHVVGLYGYDFGQFADRVAVALWNRPIAAVDPATLLPSGRVFADRGLYWYRSGWKTGPTGDEVTFALSSGKYWGGHIQEDRGQFTLTAYGQRFAADCGAVASIGTPKETAAHNLILVDGFGQHNAGASIGTDGEIVASLMSPMADYVRTDLRAAYATYSEFNSAGRPFPFSDWSWGYDGGNPLERADRTCLVVKGGPVPAWVLIGDDVRKDGATHNFDWLLHTSQTNTVDLMSDPVQLAGIPATCDVYFAHPRPADLALSSAPFQHQGPDPPTRRIVARAATVEPRFAVALVPHRNEIPSPAYSATDDGVATTVRLDWGSVQDVVVFDPSQTPTTGDLETDATVAFVRRAGGVVASYLVGDGTSLREQHADLVVLGERASAALAGDVLHLSRADIAFTAWGPSIATVLGPTGLVPFRRDGEFVSDLSTTDAEAGRGAAWIEPPHPNPATGMSLARFALARAGHVRARVVDVRGSVVATLVDAPLAAGLHALRWPGTDAGGRRVAAGVYFLRLETAGAATTHKLVRAD